MCRARRLLACRQRHDMSKHGTIRDGTRSIHEIPAIALGEPAAQEAADHAHVRVGRRRVPAVRRPRGRELCTYGRSGARGPGSARYSAPRVDHLVLAAELPHADTRRRRRAQGDLRELVRRHFSRRPQPGHRVRGRARLVLRRLSRVHAAREAASGVARESHFSRDRQRARAALRLEGRRPLPAALELRAQSRRQRYMGGRRRRDRR